MSDKYEAVIGLEVHAQLKTETKIFCGCSAEFGNEPNSNVCPVCLGHPGVLPVLNKKVVDFSILMGLATQSTINQKSIFARKNYFYPDLPKGYQISQFELPICEFGKIEIEKSNGEKKEITIKRIHMEEDAGKSIHDQGDETLVDVNRCGVPLIEIVSEPDMRTPEEAYLYLSKLKRILTYLDICDGNMEEGSLRCDANISIRKKGATELGTRTEVKNMNSFRNVERALQYEIERQIEALENGEGIVQQTLLWNADKNEAVPMRGKEEAHDYRYFPEPDLMPVEISNDWIEEIQSALPELPNEKLNRFMTQFNLSQYDAEFLTASRGVADYYENIVENTSDYKSASNWMMGEIAFTLKENKIEIEKLSIPPENIGKLIELINGKTISGKIAKEVFAKMLESRKPPEKIVEEENLAQITDSSAIENVVEQVLNDNPKQVEQYKSGKESVIGFFVGQVMRATQGKANPQLVNQLLREKLQS
ncbi:MAG: Asp-tRNA(Asn)/Glu-tRNA(Gln) amidotransferase subunit GatB [Chlorobi bacterium]|nr:Asp-tRNA(Asn)/Glu-tRNA(Gln) amidotransferase subunit GatB [Chlorobiota bacterium]